MLILPCRDKTLILFYICTQENVVKDKSYGFALKVVKLYKQLVYDEKEYVLSKQLLRSGTSIGANVEEAIGGQSERDFLAKISISYKEARESKYWLRLLKDGEFLSNSVTEPLISDCDELIKILGSIQKTLQEKIHNS